MTDRPILFSAPMVQALLAGRKTQTRRVFKPHGFRFYEHPISGDRYEESNKHGVTGDGPMGGFLWGDGLYAYLPYAPGDRLWVKETWGINHYLYCRPQPIPKTRPLDLENHEMVYFATEDDCEINNEMPRTPSIFMTRWASRLTLLVTDVRVERLQDCSEADAIAEGLIAVTTGELVHYGAKVSDAVWRSPVQAYEALWDAINGPGSWDANPWVVAISFEVQHRNIDTQESTDR